MDRIQLIGFLIVLLEHNGIDGQSLARLKNVTMSSQLDSWVGSNAVDGNYSRNCRDKCCAAANTKTNETGPWIEIDLGETNTFTRIVLYGRTDETLDKQKLNGLNLYLDNVSVSSINTTDQIYNFYHFELTRPYTARFIKLLLGGQNKILVLCEVDVFNDINISTGKVASSSSTFSNWESSFAVDGLIKTQTPDECHCCAGTIKETNPWLTVDLGDTFLVTLIQVHGRTDKVFTEQSYEGLKIQLDNVDIDTVPKGRFINYHQLFPAPEKIGRHIKFILTGSNRLLVICEVVIYGERVISIRKQASTISLFSNWDASRAVDGDYRTLPDQCNCCSATESEKDPYLRLNLENVYRVTRIAIYGRTDKHYPGQNFKGLIITLGNSFTRNVTAHQPDEWIYFYAFQLSTPVIINEVTVTLPGDHIQLVVCELIVYGDCKTSWYGQNCLESCGQCKGNQTCNHITGHCSECAEGYNITDPLCKTECSGGYFGAGCSGHCHCEGLTCPTITGVCPSGICTPGYWGTTCSENCKTCWYGQNCSKSCGHCKGNQTCNHVTGECSDCTEGYNNTDPFCKTECKNGTYGQNCSNECGKCSNNGICNKANGTCITCMNGYNETDMTCKTECNDGTYGRNCVYECGNCSNNEICNKVNGGCINCTNGYDETDRTCQTECENGTFGRNCSKECGYCSHNEVCDKVDGHCTLCSDGYNETDVTCKRECKNGTYGRNCSNECGNCSYNGICNKANGACITCLNGYNETDMTCKTECNDGTNGRNCVNECGNCSNNEICNKINGACINCTNGYNETDMTCKTECEHGTFGRNCSNVCGYCSHNEVCDKVDGHCTLCSDGYNETDVTCKRVCDYGYYGFECNETCGHYCQNESCHHIYGNCTCIQGYGGTNCEDELPTQKSDDAVTATPVIAGVTLSVAIVAVVVVALVIIKRRRSNSTTQKAHEKLKNASANDVMFNETSLNGDFQNRNTEDTDGKPEVENKYCNVTTTSHGIHIHQLWDYIAAKKQDNNEEFANEFGGLSDGLIFSYNDALANRVKNRYREMFPYDHSRVHLTVEVEGESEFINASHIDGYNEERKFIASQGPTKVMVDDFWRMVWQQKTTTIVMLTNLVETGTVKCIQYWPDKGTLSYERINITLIKESTIPDYTVRILEIKQDNEKPHQVTHFHYKAWPDKDVPDSTWSLVQFWRKVFKDKETKSGPVVVHCSAGVGRTGTFIALDNLYHQAVNRGSVTPFDVVEKLRQQRVKMVQTCEQYVYLHEAVADALLFGTHYVWQSQFSDYYDFMIKKDRENNQIRLKVQYQMVNKSLNEKRLINGKELCAAAIDEYRPKQYKGNNMENSDITLLPGIDGGNIYLLTKSTYDGTIEECLKTVDNHSVKTIITLVEDKQSKINPWSDTKQVYGDFLLDRGSEKETGSFVERTFTYTKDIKTAGTSNPQTRSITQFDLALSLDLSQDSPGVIQLLDSVCTNHPHMSSNERIMIQSSDVTHKGSVICAILNEKIRMAKEGGHINILESVISLRRRDRSCISTYEQYRYIHDVILQIVETEEKPAAKLSDDDCNIYQNM